MTKANGGYIYDTRTISYDETGNGYHKYEVIDDNTGDVLQIAKSYSEAFNIAMNRGISTNDIIQSDISRLSGIGSF